MGKRCFECSRAAVYKHHVVPKSRGGKRTVMLCDDCHAKAHHQAKHMTMGSLAKDALTKIRLANRRYSGYIPYGYNLGLDGIMLIRNVDEQMIIDEIWLMRDKGMSFPNIARCLSERGISTKHGHKIWNQSTVRAIVQRRNRE